MRRLFILFIMIAGTGVPVLAADNGPHFSKRASVSAHRKKVRGVAFSPDGQLFVSAADDHTVILWQVANGTLKRAIDPRLGHTAVVFARDGKTLFIARGSGRTTLDVFDIQTRKTIRTIQAGHAVESVSVSPDGRRVATGAFLDRHLKLWDVNTGKLIRAFTTPIRPGPGAVIGINRPMGYTAFSPDGKYIVGCSTSGSHLCIPTVWDAKTLEVRSRFVAHSNRAMSLAFSPDAKTLAMGMEGGRLHLWDVATVVDAWSKREKNQAHAQKVASLIKQLDDDRFENREAAQKQLTALGDAVGPALRKALGKSPSAEMRRRIKQILAKASAVEMLTALEPQVVLSDTQRGAVRSLSFTQDGRLLAAGSWQHKTEEGQLTVWDLKRPAEPIFNLQTTGIEALAFSPDGNTLATGMHDGSITLWDVK